MAGENRFAKLQHQTPKASGLVTVFPIISRKTGNPPFGLGISEHKPGIVNLNLNYDEAIYMLEGDLEIVCGEERYKLETGDVMWMPRGAEMQYVVVKACRYIYVTSPASPNS